MKMPRDRVVFITGASSGIGRATAEAFLRDGARVAVCSRRPVSDLEAFYVPCDVRRREDVRKAIDAVVAKFGELHVLVNNAGFGVYTAVADMKDEDFEDIFRTNVFGPFYAVQAALPHLKKTRGQVINISSILGRASIPYAAAYCMTKHALHAFSKSLRVELRPHGVRVIEVGPGLTDTNFQSSARLTGISKPLVAKEGQKGWPAEKVARAILRASKRGRREVWLTADGKLFMFVQRAFPRMADWGMARWASRLAFSDPSAAPPAP